MHRTYSWTLALLGALPHLGAQDLVDKAAPQKHPVFLYGGVIHTVSGPVHEAGAILFSGGKIQFVGKREDAPKLPEGTRSVDLQGSHVYPGLVTVHTSLGLAEIGSVPMSIDTSEVGNLTPEVRANIAVNPDSTAIPVARSNGILTAGVFPTGGLVSGRGSAMSTDGWTWRDMTLVDDVGLAIGWPRFQAEDSVKLLDELLESGRAWHAAKAVDAAIPTDVRLQALGPVLRRETKVFVRADDLASIEAATQWASRNKLRLVIIGGRDANLCTTLLKRHRVEVVVAGTHSTPKRRDSRYDERFVLPKQLEDAGVLWCLGTRGQFANERNLPYQAASAVAFGLSEDAAIRSITLSAARTLGIADRVGSLGAGKDATLIVTNGSPLDLTTLTETAFIAGREVSLFNKQRALAKKYRTKYRQLREYRKRENR